MINSRSKKYRFGTQDGSLKIYNLTDAEAGQYECIAKTNVGFASSISSVRVHGPPGNHQINKGRYEFFVNEFFSNAVFLNALSHAHFSKKIGG